jgi:hypothetical protein
LDDVEDAVTHRGDTSEDHAHSAALMLEAAQQESKPRRHRMWVPPAPTEKDGIKPVVLSPTHARPTNSPVRLRDLIQPEKGERHYNSYVPGESEYTQAEKFHFGVTGTTRNERRAKKWAEAAARYHLSVVAFGYLPASSPRAHARPLRHQTPAFRCATARGMDHLSAGDAVVCSLKNPAAEAWCMSEGWNGMLQNRSAGHQKLLEVAMDGNVGAMAQLGAALYERGDKIQAVSWLHKGASMDHTPSKELMERFGLTHIGVPAVLSLHCVDFADFGDYSIRFLLLSPPCRGCTGG